jgi:hypothetical protein
MKSRYIKLIILFTGLIVAGSCKRSLNINQDPDRLLFPNNTVYPQLLTNAQVTMGFEGGSDLFRYSTLIMQQMSGLASAPNQTYEFSRYNITGTDENNLWGSYNANCISDLEQVIRQSTALSSPHYAGVAKIMKAYEYSLLVDAFGDIPYTEAQQLLVNTQPHYDNASTIYPKLIALLTEGIADVNAATSLLSPGTNSTIYTNASFTTARPFWIKMANTLKLRLLLHYSKLNPAFAVSQITALVNTAGITFLSANTDNFSHPFFNASNQRNSIETFERNRAGYLYADRNMTEMMNAKNDPRRPFYFAIFPFDFVPFTRTTSQASTGNIVRIASTTTGIVNGMTVTGTGVPNYTIVSLVTVNTAGGFTDVTLDDFGPVTFVLPSIASGTVLTFKPEYRGVSAAAPPLTAQANYSRIHTFLRGAVLTGAAPPAGYASVGSVQPFTYTGAAPQRMITFAEYNFIRAEAALMGVGAPADAQTFFTAGITASMQEVGVAQTDINNYLAVNGTLTGTNANKLKQIIEEKYIALFGVTMEPWTDWRRTGYPVLTPPTNRLSTVPTVPRSLLYPQTEIDLNGNHPPQKSGDLQTRVFWDNP